MDQEFSHLRGSFSYRPDIDGLRAVAVLPVLFFHMGLGCSGGYVGVDIFFVISGYLITSLIIREMLNDEFTLRAFWERRIRRIFPVAALVTIIVITAGVWILLPDTFRSLGKAGIAQVMMVANFYFWQQDGYFAGPSDLEPLLHMWSLAVEEQFYFLFPMLLLFLMKRGQKTTVWVIILISILSLLLSFHGVIYDKGTTFYLLPARAWELALGALVALLPLRSIGAAWGRQLVALAGLALILWPVFAYDVATPFPGLGAIPPCLGTALLIWVGQSGTTWVGGLLAQRPIVYIGKISFSLYLWHWPLIVYARHLSIYEISLNVRVALLVASLVLAVLSHQFVETPFRRKRIVAKRRQVFKLFGCMSGAMVVAFAAVYFLDGIPQRFRGDTVRFAEISMEMPDDPDINPDFTEFPKVRPKSEDPVLPVLIWGDSHAGRMISAFRKLCEDNGVNGYYATRGSTPPLLGINFLPDETSLAPHNDRVLEVIDRDKIRTVIMIGRWEKYVERGRLSRESPLSDRDATGRPSEDVFRDAVLRTVNALRERDVQVVIMKQVPLQFRSPPSALWMVERFGYDPTKAGVTVAEHKERQKFINSVLDSVVQPGVEVIDPLPLLSHDNGHTKVSEGKRILYMDPNHVSKEGAFLLRPLFKPYFRSSPAVNP